VTGGIHPAVIRRGLLVASELLHARRPDEEFRHAAYALVVSARRAAQLELGPNLREEAPDERSDP